MLMDIECQVNKFLRRAIYNLKDIVKFSRQRRKVWNEHVNWMQDNRIAKIVRDGIPLEKRKL